MRNIWVIFRKELRIFFDSPIAYIFIITFLAFSNWLFFRSFFFVGQISMRDFFFFLPWTFLVFIPTVTMRLWAEEKKIGTIEVLLTLPVKNYEVVGGKFFASFIFMLITLGLSFSLPLTLYLLGEVDFGPIIGGYLGACFLGAAYLAIGLFVSNLAENQIVAFIIAAVLSFALFIIGENIVLATIPSSLVPLLSFLGLGTHFTSLQRGVIDTRDLVYYLSVIGFFLFLNIQSIEARKWSQRISSSTNLIFLVLIVLGFLGIINYLASRHFARVDLTQNKLYTLSEASKKVVNRLDDIVNINCYFSKNLPSYVISTKQQVSDILDEYRAYARGNIQVKFIDPTEDPALEQKLRFMGIPQVQLNVMEKDQATATNVYMGIAVTYEDKQEVIPFVKNVNNLEYEITSSILKVTRKEKKTVGFLAGHEEYSIYSDYQTVYQALRRQYEVKQVPAQTIPADINVLVVAGPHQLTEQAKYEIDQYIMRGGKVIFLIDIVTVPQEGGIRATYRETNLNDLLENYGVRVTKNLVLDRFNMLITFQTGYTILRTPYPFYIKVIKEEKGFDPDNPIVNQLNSMVFPWVSALEPLKETHQDLQFTVLVQSSRYSWLQKGIYDLNPLQEFMPQPEDTRSYPLAILVSGKFKSFFADKEAPPPPTPEGKEQAQRPPIIKQCEKDNQIIVVANARFIHDNYADLPGNVEFFLNAVDWFTWGKDLIGIRSRIIVDWPLPFLTERQKSTIKFINIGGVPILVALFGVIRVYFRRKRTITLENLK